MANFSDFVLLYIEYYPALVSFMLVFPKNKWSIVTHFLTRACVFYTCAFVPTKQLISVILSPVKSACFHQWNHLLCVSKWLETCTHTWELCCRIAFCPHLSREVQRGRESRESRGRIFLRGGVALQAEIISLVRSRWEEPENRCLTECELGRFNKNVNDIRDFYDI